MLALRIPLLEGHIIRVVFDALTSANMHGRGVNSGLSASVHDKHGLVRTLSSVGSQLSILTNAFLPYQRSPVGRVNRRVSTFTEGERLCVRLAGTYLSAVDGVLQPPRAV